MMSEQIRASRLVTTDTATVVLFDPAALADKVTQECDWWTGTTDLAREESLGTLISIATGSDGTFHLDVSVGPVAFQGVAMKRRSLLVPSGTLLFGAAECLPGEGETIREYLGELAVQPGRYHVVVTELPATSTGLRHFWISLVRAPAA